MLNQIFSKTKAHSRDTALPVHFLYEADHCAAGFRGKSDEDGGFSLGHFPELAR